MSIKIIQENFASWFKTQSTKIHTHENVHYRKTTKYYVNENNGLFSLHENLSQFINSAHKHHNLSINIPKHV